MAPAVINVNSLTDVLVPANGIVSLRSAIQTANTNGDASNTINLTLPGAYKITLAGTPGETDNVAGEFAILPRLGTLTIANTSGGTAIVDANHLGRAFDINPGNTNDPNTKLLVVMQGFTIENGYVTDAANADGPNASGGGIRDQGNASLTLTNMVVTHNSATADGGGVVMENVVSTPWTLTVNNSTISYNHAGDAGGGIDEDGSGKVFVNPGTVINGNTSVNQGAGIWLDAINGATANLTVTGALVNGNSALAADNVGGGIGNAGNGVVTIVNTTLENNFSGGVGGGFGDENAAGTLVVQNSLFLNNTSFGAGGGISAGGPVTTITSTEFNGNGAGATGGGLFANGLTLTVQSATFVDNAAATNGGGIELETTGNLIGASSTITNTTLTDNAALNAGGGNYGGGIDAGAAFTGSVKLQSDTINGNNATFGGGLFWASQAGSTVQVEDTIIAGNNAAIGSDVGQDQLFTATLSPASEVPPANNSHASGIASLLLSPDQALITIATTFNNLANNPAAINLGVAPPGANGPIPQDANGNPITLANLPANTSGTVPLQSFMINQGLQFPLGVGNVYENIGDFTFAGGEIRGNFNAVNIPFTDQGGNLIGNPTGSTGFTAATTQHGSANTPLDPMLGALASNLGPVVGAPGTSIILETEVLPTTSPAFARGVANGAPATDARGFPRVSNNAIDVGATQTQTGINFESDTRTLDVHGNMVTYTQATTADALGLHTTYTFTVDGQVFTIPDAAVAQVIVGGTGAKPIFMLTTSDTYLGTNGQTHETVESFALGNGGGVVAQLKATGAVNFMQIIGFTTVDVFAGPADIGQISGTVGVANTFVGAGNFAYMNSGSSFYYIGGAKYVYGYAANPADLTYEYDGSGPSTLVISGVAYSYMTGTDAGAAYFNEGVGFRNNYAVAKHPGQDSAYFFDSPANDVFVGNSSTSYMYSTDAGGNFTEFDEVMGSFAQIIAESFVGGTDFAYNHDTAHIKTAGFHVLS